MIIDGNVKVGIGTMEPTERLSVKGNIRAQEIKVEAANWPDYVFQNNYALKPLSEVEQYLEDKKTMKCIFFI